MNSLEEDTQQPSYHVTAQVLNAPQEPPVQPPTSQLQSAYGTLQAGSTVESHESHLHWGETPKEPAVSIHPPTSSPDKALREVERVGDDNGSAPGLNVVTRGDGDGDDRPGQLKQSFPQRSPEQAGHLSTTDVRPSQPMLPAVVANPATSLPSTSDQVPQPVANASEEEQPRTSPSRPSVPSREDTQPGQDDGPTVSSPSEPGPRRTPPPEPAANAHITFRDNFPTPGKGALRTPSKSKNQPNSAYTPSPSKKVAHPTQPSAINRPSPKRHRTFARTKSGRSIPETERDSFEDEAPMGPRQRVERIFRAESRETSASAVPDRQDHGGDTDVSDHEKTPSKSPNPAANAPLARAGSPQPLQPSSTLPPLLLESESSEILFSSNENPPPRGHFRHLASTPSRSEPELGRLFSQTFTDFGMEDPEESQLNFHATQTIKSSAPEPPATSSPAPPPAPPAAVAEQSAKTNDGASASSTGTGTAHTNVPAHRRLGRTNPRVENSQPPRSVKSAPVSHQPAVSPTLPLIRRAPQSVGAPERMPSAFEATLVDRPSPPPRTSSPPRQQDGVVATYVTGGLPSPDSLPAPEPKTSSNESLAPIMPLTSPSSDSVPLPTSHPVLPSSPPKTPEQFEPVPAKPTTPIVPTQPAPATTTQQSSTTDQVKTLPQPTSPKLTTPTQYGKRKKKLSARALEALSDVDTDESSSPAPEDPEDYTFRPAPKKIKLNVPQKPKRATEKKRKAPAKIKLTVSKKQDDEGDVTMTESSISELSDSESSSSAPEDLEDNTYRPGGSRTDALKTIKTRLSKTSSRSRASSSSTSAAKPAKSATTKGKGKTKSTRPSTDTSNAEIALPRRLSLSHPSTPTPTPSAPLRVLGYWGQSKAYFPGTVGELIDGKFRVDFADGMSRDLPIDRLRLLELREGDQIRSSSKRFADGTMTVVEEWDGHDRGVKVRVEGTIAGFIPLADMYITEAVVKRAWDDRLVEPRHLGLSSGSKLTRSGGKATTSDALRGMVFLITLNVDIGDASAAARKMLMETIHRQGGRVQEDWPVLFDRPSDGFGSTLETKDTPFLLVHGGEKTKPKMLAALAAGVPCISSDFVRDTLERAVDWRSYLISPGYSTVLNHHTSQLVDPHWGGDDWSVETARNLRQPFEGKKFLFVLPTDTNSISESVKALVPFCLHALGAESLSQVASVRNVPNLGVYDFVLVEDRDSEWSAIPAVWKKSGKLCNFMWLKQCIMSGGLVPAGLL